MSKLDIRGVNSPPSTIVFADDSYGYATQITLRSRHAALVDCDGDDESNIDAKDFDNLILALQKAQELGWGK